MTDPEPLEREAVVFGRYLVGGPPSDYGVAKYRSLSRTAPFDGDPVDRFDRALLAAARWHPLVTRIADLHARFFRPTTRLRKKLILLMAILESSPGSAPVLNRSGGGLLGSIGVLVVVGLTSVAVLVAGLIVFLPVRVVTAVWPGAR